MDARTIGAAAAALVAPERLPMATLAAEQAGHLLALQAQINFAVRAAEDHARSAMDSALEAGRLLARAKELLPHGKWESWLVANCAVAPRTAQAYMRLFSRLQTLPPVDAQHVALLPVREAIKAIATDPQAPLRHPSTVRIAGGRSEADRVSKALCATASAIRKVSRDTSQFGMTKRSRIEQARKKLKAALHLLDQIEGDPAAPAVEVFAERGGVRDHG